MKLENSLSICCHALKPDSSLGLDNSRKFQVLTYLFLGHPWEEGNLAPVTTLAPGLYLMKSDIEQSLTSPCFPICPETLSWHITDYWDWDKGVKAMRNPCIHTGAGYGFVLKQWTWGSAPLLSRKHSTEQGKSASLLQLFRHGLNRLGVGRKGKSEVRQMQDELSSYDGPLWMVKPRSSSRGEEWHTECELFEVGCRAGTASLFLTNSPRCSVQVSNSPRVRITAKECAAGTAICPSVAISLGALDPQRFLSHL